MKKLRQAFELVLCILIGIAMLVLIARIFSSAKENTHRAFSDNPVVRQSVDIHKKSP